MATLHDVEDLAMRAARASRAGASTQPFYDELRETFVALRGNVGLTAKIQSLLALDRAAGQFALRTARAVFARLTLKSEDDRLLLSFPCLVEVSDTTVDWARLASELQGWANLYCAPTGTVVVAPAPVLLSTIECASAVDAPSGWLHELAHAGQIRAMPEIPPRVALSPALWQVALTATASQVARLEERLAQPRRLTQEFSALKNRTEQLAETDGITLSLFPLSSWANGFSLARIVYFRQTLRQALKQNPLKTRWRFLLAGNQLIEQGRGGESLAWGVFPEETFEDVQAMLLAAGTAHGIKLELSRVMPQLDLLH